MSGPVTLAKVTSRQGLFERLSQPQHRTTVILLANTGMLATSGLLFWILLARLADEIQISVGFTIISLGMVAGLLAKGGLDTALLRKVPEASRRSAATLLRVGALTGGGVAAMLALAMAFVAWGRAALPEVISAGWVVVGAIGLLLVVTWLQDAYFLAEGRPQDTFLRNSVFGFTRLVFAIAVLAYSVAHQAAVAWALALAASALAGAYLVRRLPAREGRDVPAAEYLQVSNRNVAGGIAEFLPGLLLVPIALALVGPIAAAAFALAWSVGQLLFLTCSAIGRSALAEMSRKAEDMAEAVGRGLVQITGLVLPGALAVLLLAPWLLGLFGDEYAAEGTAILRILAASAFFVAPWSLYLAVLRARDRTKSLIAFPVVMILALALLAPLFASRLGAEGVAWAWLVANVPVGLFGAWKTLRIAQGVTPFAPPVRRGSHVE